MPTINLNPLDFARATQGGAYATDNMIVGWDGSNKRVGVMRFALPLSLGPEVTINAATLVMMMSPSGELRSDLDIRSVNGLPADTAEMMAAVGNGSPGGKIATSGGIAIAGDVIFPASNVEASVDLTSSLEYSVDNGYILGDHPIALLFRPILPAVTASHTLVAGSASLIIDYTLPDAPEITNAVINAAGDEITLTFGRPVSLTSGGFGLFCEHDTVTAIVPTVTARSASHTFTLSRRIDTIETPIVNWPAGRATDQYGLTAPAHTFAPVTNSSTYVMPVPAIVSSNLDRLGRILTVQFDQAVYYQNTPQAAFPFAKPLVLVDSTTYPNKPTTVTPHAIFSSFGKIELNVDPSHTDDVVLYGRHFDASSNRIINAAGRGVTSYTDFSIENRSRVVGGQDYLIFHGDGSPARRHSIDAGTSLLFHPDATITPTDRQSGSLEERHSLATSGAQLIDSIDAAVPLVVSAETDSAIAAGHSVSGSPHLRLRPSGRVDGEEAPAGNSNLILYGPGSIESSTFIDEATTLLIAGDGTASSRDSITGSPALVHSLQAIDPGSTPVTHTITGSTSLLFAGDGHVGDPSDTVTGDAQVLVAGDGSIDVTAIEHAVLEQGDQISAAGITAEADESGQPELRLQADGLAASHPDSFRGSMGLVFDPIGRSRDAKAVLGESSLIAAADSFAALNEIIQRSVTQYETLTAVPFVEAAAPGEMRSAMFAAGEGPTLKTSTVDTTTHTIIASAGTAGPKTRVSGSGGMLFGCGGSAGSSTRHTSIAHLALQPVTRVAVGNVASVPAAAILTAAGLGQLSQLIRLDWIEPPSTRLHRSLIVVQFQYSESWLIDNVRFQDPSGVIIPHMVRAHDVARRRLKVLLQPYHRPDNPQPIYMRVQQ